MASLRESDDDYSRGIAQLGPDHRVIVCADNWQWIVQIKQGKRWISRHYCTSREGVIRRGKGLPEWEGLTDLPDRFSPDRASVNLSREPSGNRCNPALAPAGYLKPTMSVLTATKP
jgi:hypothetical protein